MKKRHIILFILVVCISFVVWQIILGRFDKQREIDFRRKVYAADPMSKPKSYLIEKLGEPTSTGPTFYASGRARRKLFYRPGPSFYLFPYKCEFWVEADTKLERVVLLDTSGEND